MMFRTLGIVLIGSVSIASMAQPVYEDRQNLLVYKDAQDGEAVIRTAEQWERRADQVRQSMEQVMGALPSRSDLGPLDMRVEESWDGENYTRQKITFNVGDDVRLPAYLLLPKGEADNRPAAVCLHPTSVHGKGMVVGLGDKENRNYAEELAERGYVTLAPDYPTFGDYDIDVYARGWESATAKGIWNHMRGVDLLQSLDMVNPERIVSIGHSLGGHNTLFLGVFDERVKAMVTSCGFTRFARYYGGDLTGWSHKGYMPRIASAYGKDPAQMPFDFTEILGALAPRPVFISAPLHDDNFDVQGVRKCVDAAKPVYELYGAADALQAVYPDCAHDFPPAVREAAYTFLEEALTP
jgi:dienelactone hydrolase